MSPFRVSDDVVAKRMGDELVLVHLETNKIQTLNKTAARFWELLAEGLERPAITAQLQAEFEVDAAVLEAEVDALLEELAASKLIVAAQDS